jgi:hypothetical protein
MILHEYSRYGGIVYWRFALSHRGIWGRISSSKSLNRRNMVIVKPSISEAKYTRC